MHLVKKLVVTVLAVAGFMYLGLVAWGWVVTDGFSQMSGSYSAGRGCCSSVVLALSVSPDFTRVAKHEKQMCEGGVEERFLSIAPYDGLGRRVSSMVLVASNAEGSFNPLPMPVLPIRMYWKSVNELWVQHQWAMNFHVDSLSGVDVEVGRYMP